MPIILWEDKEQEQLQNIFRETKIETNAEVTTLEALYLKNREENNQTYNKWMCIGTASEDRKSVDIEVLRERELRIGDPDADGFIDTLLRAKFYVEYIAKTRLDMRRLIEGEDKTAEYKKEALENYNQSIAGQYGEQNSVYIILKKIADIGLVMVGNDGDYEAAKYNELSYALARKCTISDIYIQFTMWRLSGEAQYLEEFASQANLYFMEYLGSLSEFSNTLGVRYGFEEVYRSLNAKLPYGADYEPADRLLILASKALSIAMAVDSLTNGTTKSKVWDRDDFTRYYPGNENISRRTVSAYEFVKAYSESVKRVDANYERIKQSTILIYQNFCRANDILWMISEVAGILDKWKAGEQYGFNEDTLEKYTEWVTEVSRLYLEILRHHKGYYALDRARVPSGSLVQKEMIAELNEVIERKGEMFDDTFNCFLTMIDAYTKRDIDNLLQTKQEFANKVGEELSDTQKEQLDIIIRAACTKIQEVLVQDDLYRDMRDSVTNYLRNYRHRLREDRLSNLITGEVLYHMYIKDKTEINGFDYSFVSIMYYQALEEFVNELVYKPYKREYLEPAKRGGLSLTPDYLNKDKPYMIKESGGYRFKDSCELGPLSYLFINIDGTVKFKEFMGNQFGITNIDQHIRAFKSLGRDMKDKSILRNTAAHGAEPVEYDKAQYDKNAVYDPTEARGLLIKFLNLVNQR